MGRDLCEAPLEGFNSNELKICRGRRDQTQLPSARGSVVT